MNLDKISYGEVPNKVNVIIEIAKGSKNKYEIDKESGAIFLDRVLHTSMHYPADYGFVPHTLCDDGDPLDALVFISQPTFPGCVIEARPIGVLEMSDEKGFDDKLICVACNDPNFIGVNDLCDMPEGLISEISHFFEQYKALEKGKFSKVEKACDVEKAKEIVMKSIEFAKSKKA